MPKLFGDGIVARCVYCQHGERVRQLEHINCRYKGVVTDGYSCRRFRYDPLKRIPRPYPTLPRFSAEDFSLEDEGK